MGDTAKRGAIYTLVGLTPVAILSLILFGTNNPKEGSKSALKGLVDGFTNAGPLGIVSLVFIITSFVFAYLAWKSKQEQIHFMQSVIDTGREEFRENQEFSSIQAQAYQELAATVKESSEKITDLIKGLTKAEKKIMRRVDAMALADSNVDKEKYFAQRGGED